jgi:aspartate/methionine/tyrosine aminotransferase
VSEANDWRIDFEQLQLRVSKRTKLIIVNTPSNPLGKRFDRRELLQLAAFAQQHNLFIIADEVSFVLLLKYFLLFFKQYYIFFFQGL